MFWFYVLPLGFLLTQYTITGFDASRARLRGDARRGGRRAPRACGSRSSTRRSSAGSSCWRSRSPSATRTRSTRRRLRARAIFERAMTDGLGCKLVLIIALVGQLFCGMRCLTSASRMMYAFSRDGAIPGSQTWSRVNATRDPVQRGASSSRCCALIITLPALKGNKDGIPVAFFAVVSIAVIGLYIALRRSRSTCAGARATRSSAGPWNLGREVQVDEPDRDRSGSLIVVIIFSLPFSSGRRARGTTTSSWELVQLRAGRDRRRWRSSSAIWWVVSAQQDVHWPAEQTIAELDRRDRRAAAAPRGPVGPQDLRASGPSSRRAGRAPSARMA